MCDIYLIHTHPVYTLPVWCRIIQSRPAFAYKSHASNSKEIDQDPLKTRSRNYYVMVILFNLPSDVLSNYYRSMKNWVWERNMFIGDTSWTDPNKQILTSNFHDSPGSPRHLCSDIQLILYCYDSVRLSDRTGFWVSNLRLIVSRADLQSQIIFFVDQHEPEQFPFIMW